MPEAENIPDYVACPKCDGSSLFAKVRKALFYREGYAPTTKQTAVSWALFILLLPIWIVIFLAILLARATGLLPKWIGVKPG